MVKENNPMVPKVIIHSAVSADGRMDWFPADIAKYYELTATWNEDATLVGSQTILNPDVEVPDETEEDLVPRNLDPKDTRPFLVVPDSRGRVRTWHYWRKQSYWRDVLVLCSEATPKSYLDYLAERGIQFFVSGKDKADIGEAFKELVAKFGVKTVRVDSGGTLNGVLLRQGLVDEVSILLHPSLVGGLTPKSLYLAKDLTSADEVLPLRMIDVQRLENDIVWVRYEVVK